MEDYAKLLPHHPQHSSSSSSMTLFSRLDHLDFVMKYLERKRRLERVGGSDDSERGMETKCMSLDVALKDTYFKGSLLDRVAALEHKLFQLCLEMDSGSSSNPSSLTSTQTSAEISSSSPKQFCRGEPSSSYPTFHYPSHGGTSQISQVQEKPQTQRHQQKKKQQSPSKGQLGKTRTGKDEVGSCKNVKKGIPPPKWPHLRMFGC